jgi:excisionase family DNA binding protein
MSRPQRVIADVAPKILTLLEVSKYLNVSPATIYRLLRQKEIPAFRLAGNWRFNIKDLKLWMDNKSQKSEPRDTLKS